MDRFNAMRVFVKTAELRSFTKAAEQLNIPRASVTIAVQELEASLKAQLLNRTTRSVHLTTDGAIYLDRCKDILSDLEEVDSMFKTDHADIQGKIRINMASTLACDFFIPQLPEFLAEYPGLEIELLASDNIIDLFNEGVDLSIRGTENNTPLSTAERFIGTSPMINVASPDYLARYGTPNSLEDLKAHKLIYYTQNFAQRDECFEFFDGIKNHSIAMSGNIIVGNTDAYKEACLAGLGICQNPLAGILGQLRSGRLIEILPYYRAAPMQISFVFAERRFPSKRVRAFIEWIEPRLKKFLTETV